MHDLDTEQTFSRRLWIFAALSALALHVGGGALAVAHLRVDDPDDTFGAPAIEIGLEMTSPHLKVTDLPPGPNADAAVASAAVAEQKADVKEAEVPRDVAVESNDPDRAVTPSNSREPKEENIKVANVQTSASMESVAVEATATPSFEANPEGPRSVAPVQGTGESAQHMRASWQKKLIAHLDRQKRYPADRSQKSAEIVVGFALDRMGRVLSTRIVKGSGDAVFDEAALTMVQRSDPVPQPPPLVADAGLNFTLPVIFRVKAGAATSDR